ncbi:hypothetical protein [Flavobacterium sp.]|jgi:hypothetical protein|uniref:hypothetical protein n=1 Tax=Flavobacterium sp. TaxID=239 RepID=UPI0037BF95B8
MNDQQLAAMQGALLALEDAHRRDEHSAARWVYSEAMDALREALARPQDVSKQFHEWAITEHENIKAQPQGEWVDLTDDEVIALEREVGCFAIGQLGAVLAKFKEKNTPPVVQQGEPVAWGYFDADGSFMDAVGWQHGAYQTPLYTTSPSVESNDYVLCEVQQEWYVKGWKDAAEKAAKVVDDLSGGDMWIQGIAENIRGMGK